jgi:PTH1 family peptidyl-tRNA hydrolase
MKLPIKLIIGLGNPGQSFYYHRHSIGFRVLDALAEKYHAHWQERQNMEMTQVPLGDSNVYLVKPQTYMNNSGAVLSFFTKKGIKAEDILVVHDELEIPFGKVTLKQGGSARGHNGLKSIISVIGDNFHRLRVGIGRPENREDVPDYVLSNFPEGEPKVTEIIQKALDILS